MLSINNINDMIWVQSLNDIEPFAESLVAYQYENRNQKLSKIKFGWLTEKFCPMASKEPSEDRPDYFVIKRFYKKETWQGGCSLKNDTFKMIFLVRKLTASEASEMDNQVSLKKLFCPTQKAEDRVKELAKRHLVNLMFISWSQDPSSIIQQVKLPKEVVRLMVCLSNVL